MITKPPARNGDGTHQATYLQLLGDGKAFVELVGAFILALGFQLKHKATCHGGGTLSMPGSVEWRWKAGEYQQRWRGLHLGNLDVLARTSLSAIVSAPEPTPIFGLFRQSR